MAGNIGRSRLRHGYATPALAAASGSTRRRACAAFLRTVASESVVAAAIRNGGRGAELPDRVGCVATDECIDGRGVARVSGAAVVNFDNKRCQTPDDFRLDRVRA